MKRLAKALILAALAFSAVGAARAATNTVVQIRPTGSLQPGTTSGFHTSSGTVDTFTASTTTVTKETVGTLTPTNITGTVTDSSTMTHTGGQTFNGSFNAQSGTFTVVSAPQVTASTLTVNGNTIQATAGTRTYTLPDAGANAQIIESTGTQTLSNKSLDNATLSNALNANSQKIVNITSGTVNSDVARYSQVKVIQIVYASVNTSSSTTGNAFINTNLTATITPTSTSSQILIFATGSLSQAASGFSGVATIARGATNLYAGDTNNAGAVARGNGATDNFSMGTMIKRDSPATTSATTYTVQIETLSGTGATIWGGQTNQTMVLMEINGQ